MKTFIFLCISYFYINFSTYAGESAIDYNLAQDVDNEARLKKIMNEVQSDRGKNKDSGNSFFTVLQHIKDDSYIIKCGEMPVNAAIIKNETGLIADDTKMSGFLFPTGKTLNYTTVTGAKKTVEIFEYQNGEYAFQNTAQFIKCVKHAPHTFYCFGDNVKCENCNGWGKLQARTQTGYKPCTRCSGTGKLTLRLNIVWKVN